MEIEKAREIYHSGKMNCRPCKYFEMCCHNNCEVFPLAARIIIDDQQRRIETIRTDASFQEEEYITEQREHAKTLEALRVAIVQRDEARADVLKMAFSSNMQMQLSDRKDFPDAIDIMKIQIDTVDSHADAERIAVALIDIFDSLQDDDDYTGAIADALVSGKIPHVKYLGSKP